MTVPYVIYEYDGEDVEHLNSELYNTIVFDNLRNDCIYYDDKVPGGGRIFGGWEDIGVNDERRRSGQRLVADFH